MPSQQNANRRKSVDPAAAVPGIPKSTRRPPKGRVSMIPRVGGRENTTIPPSTPSGASVGSTASSRRRSIAGDSLNNNRRQSLIPPSSCSSIIQRTDPRPISDKNFQHNCIKDLLSFLQERGYEYPVSSKSLSRPSAKDFTNITTFMLRQLDKDFQQGGMKFEDEVALNFKCMGYPYPISKTALVAAGSPHTWPALLAALTWLMHQLQCKSEYIEQDELDNCTGTPFETMYELERQTDKAFFQYLGQAYVAFMQGDAVATEKLESAFMQRFERDDAFLEQAVERVTDLNASIVERINEITQQAQE
jgi:kinetochore protein NDC80